MIANRVASWLDTQSVLDQQDALIESSLEATARSTERRAASEDGVARAHDALERSSRNLRTSMQRLLATQAQSLPYLP